ncbi:hypothetical protein FQN60_010619 [Etheostoma spectabile]|uniref:Uncharacterized protein n=1 Tax=Etheostoma spectabile TaxID=54343 RepID=A0A5J5CFB1_9PERO|nr:hypothetical protein FQN60_010619 [Etheostoma spectabile]
MNSKDDPKGPAVLGERRRGPLDQLPPPANSNKPLTPFSIEDILSKPSGRKCRPQSVVAHIMSPAEKLPPAGHSLPGRPLLSHSSPLCALEELASKTFKGLEVSVLQAAEGHTEPVSSRSPRDLGPSAAHMAPSPASSSYTERRGSKCCSEDEEEEIDVDD